MTTARIPATSNGTIEPAATTAIRSHRSYEPLVEGVCHHSGRYLTRAEMYMYPIGLLREQHDFPGYEELDTLFQPAVHSYEHQHATWSRPALQGIALIASGWLLIILLFQLLRRADQYVGIVEFTTLYTTMGVIGAVAVVAIVWGVLRLIRRVRIYHKQAAGQAPAIADYPLLCSYSVSLQERIHVDLRNDALTPPAVHSAEGSMVVEIVPEQISIDLYDRYRSIYRQPGVGDFVHAGVVALDRQRPGMAMPALEYQHRLPLRQSAAIFAQSLVVHSPLLFDAIYPVSPDVLYTPNAQYGQFILEMCPELQSYDSRTLVLRFRWLGDEHIAVKLLMCRITLPPELADVDRVEYGRRIDRGGSTEVLWNNLLFQQGELMLSIVCKEPIIEHSQMITGSYKVAVEGALSGLQARPENIWNALGQRAVTRTQPQIHHHSEIAGELRINTGLLAQEHEFACKADVIEISSPPDHAMIRTVIDVLATWRVDIRRIEQATPRLDPSGSLQMQLRYWDVSGRLYETSMLEAVDVHVVVSGSRPLTSSVSLRARMVHASAEIAQTPADAHTYIDVRVRCLHEPRSQATQRKAENIRTALERDLRSAFAAGA